MKDKLWTLVSGALFTGLVLGGVIMGLSTSAVYRDIIDDLNADHALEVASLESRIAALEEREIALRESYSFEGVASYYGTFEHGNQTANQEIFSRHAMTAASPWLPFNSVWRVTRKDTGVSVVVRINDRQPEEWGRIIDLSEAAAKIGMLRKGIVTVKLRPENGRGE